MIKILLPNGEKIPLTAEQAEKVRSQGFKHTPLTGYPLIYDESEVQPEEAPDKIKTGKLGDVDQERFKPAEVAEPDKESSEPGDSEQ
ncbi:hypothetical protein [Desulfoscipio geothermicus]|uniref:Uncharacterized protein n=1 Tax=Desulfoscipio geothermicus DSM 3669 TaxID=1121426 RepID=A0A1I6DZR9_9FIRM|nr:hypothetical protein [Desulfoscipio geothermicus]SFR11024.1 hypothetical protein SAMN05660706_12230 [Desulfoscipio geothermicus DSM 3669]